MAETKVYGDANGLTVWFALPNAFANWKKPTVAEIQATTEISRSIAWDNFSFGAQASNQNSDPGFGDVGNAQTRGFAQFGGSISFFLPSSYFPIDSTDENQVTFLALEEPETLGYIIIRADGEKTTAAIPDKLKGIVAGDFVSIYKVLSDGYADVNTGEVDFKMAITFQPQGDLWVNEYVGTTVAVATPTPIGTADYTVGGKTPLSSYITGRELAKTTGFWDGTPGWLSWVSDAPEIATVDANGVVTGVTAGDANVTAVWPATGTSSTALAITIA